MAITMHQPTHAPASYMHTCEVKPDRFTVWTTGDSGEWEACDLDKWYEEREGINGIVHCPWCGEDLAYDLRMWQIQQEPAPRPKIRYFAFSHGSVLKPNS